METEKKKRSCSNKCEGRRVRSRNNSICGNSDVFKVLTKSKTCVINDPLGQTHSPTSSEHYFHTKFVLFCDILKCGDGRTDGNMYKNNYHYRPELLVGQEDQSIQGPLE